MIAAEGAIVSVAMKVSAIVKIIDRSCSCSFHCCTADDGDHCVQNTGDERH